MPARLARYAPLALTALGALGTLTGCPGHTPTPTTPIRESSRIVTVVHERQARLRSLRAHGSADSFSSHGRLRGTVDIFVMRPDKFRVDTSAFGHTVASMASDGARVDLIEGNRHYFGRAEPCVAAQISGIPLQGTEVVEVLSGGMPLLSDNVSAPVWQDGAYVVEVQGAGGSHERVELELPSDQASLPPDQQTPRPRKVELSDAQGLRARITYEGYHAVGEFQFPNRVRIVMPREDVDTEIRFDEVVPNFVPAADPEDPDAAPPDPYRLNSPANAEEFPIECAPQGATPPPAAQAQPAAQTEPAAQPQPAQQEQPAQAQPAQQQQPAAQPEPAAQPAQQQQPTRTTRPRRNTGARH